MTLDEAVQAFSSHHRGFPVVDNSKLVGIVQRIAKMRDRQLAGILLKRNYDAPTGDCWSLPLA